MTTLPGPKPFFSVAKKHNTKLNVKIYRAQFLSVHMVKLSEQASVSESTSPFTAALVSFASGARMFHSSSFSPTLVRV